MTETTETTETPHGKLLQAVKDALEAFVEDTSVPPQTTKLDLEAIRDDIDDLIESIDDNGEEDDEEDEEEDEEEEPEEE